MHAVGASFPRRFVFSILILFLLKFLSFCDFIFRLFRLKANGVYSNQFIFLFTCISIKKNLHQRRRYAARGRHYPANHERRRHRAERRAVGILLIVNTGAPRTTRVQLHVHLLDACTSINS